jgi:hypothetical protein
MIFDVEVRVGFDMTWMAPVMRGAIVSDKLTIYHKYQRLSDATKWISTGIRYRHFDRELFILNSWIFRLELPP